MDDAIIAARLRVLFGPAGREVGCDECFDMLDRYVERELAGEDPDAAYPGMRSHLFGCPACADEHESLRELAAGHDRGATG